MDRPYYTKGGDLIWAKTIYQTVIIAVSEELMSP